MQFPKDRTFSSWLNDVQGVLEYAGFWIEYDPSLVSIIDVKAYEGSIISGPWDPYLSLYFPEPAGSGTGYLFLERGGFIQVGMETLFLQGFEFSVNRLVMLLLLSKLFQLLTQFMGVI